MINPPLHYYSIHRNNHLPDQFYLYYLTTHVLTLPMRFS
jgi:hypothetical protein